MDKLEYWRINTELTIKQATLLSLDLDPQIYAEVEALKPEDKPDGYEAYKHAILTAFSNCEISTPKLAQDEFEYFAMTEEGFSEETKQKYLPEIVDIETTKIDVDSLKFWLSKKNIRPKFFFPNDESKPNYLDPKCPYYSNKLATAILAWQYVVDNIDEIKGSPKQAVAKYLKRHAKQFQLVHTAGENKGKFITKAIEQIAEVANWNQQGGAPKTSAR